MGSSLRIDAFTQGETDDEDENYLEQRLERQGETSEDSPSNQSLQESSGENRNIVKRLTEHYVTLPSAFQNAVQSFISKAGNRDIATRPPPSLQASLLSYLTSRPGHFVVVLSGVITLL